MTTVVDWLQIIRFASKYGSVECLELLNENWNDANDTIKHLSWLDDLIPLGRVTNQSPVSATSSALQLFLKHFQGLWSKLH